MVETPSLLVSLDRVDVRFSGRTLLEDVSVSLSQGEGLAILGHNGSGKSTLLRLLSGEIWPHPGSRGQRLFYLSPSEASESPLGIREKLSLVSPEDQDRYVRRDIDLPVEAVVRSGFFTALYPETAATPEQTARTKEVAESLGVGHLLGRSMLALSRGEGRRVLLARALVRRPWALFLDEAADGLDAVSRGAFLEAVSVILKSGTAVALATHREEEIVPEIHERLLLEAGRIVDRQRRSLPGAGWPSRFFSETPPKAASAEGSVHRPGFGADPAFVLREVTVRVAGRPVLSDVDWTIRAGERWSVVGPNGAGKSTLLRLLAAEEQPASGSIRRLDLGARADRFALRTRVGLVSPEVQARHRNGCKGEWVVASGFEASIGLACEPAPERIAASRATMERLGVGNLSGRDVQSLSYGEFRKLLIARALAPGPEVLLFDEPLAGLDPEARAFALLVIEEARREGVTVVMVTHHGDELPRDGTKRARIDEGRLRVLDP